MSYLSSYTEAELLMLVAQGDETAFRQLYDRYSPKIYSLAMYLTRCDFMAEEITQEVFLKIWVKRETLGEIIFFNAYLKTMATNVANNYLKRIASEKRILQHIASELTEGESSTDETFDFRESQRLLDEAIQKLPPQQRIAYLLSRQEGLKYGEIAEKMGLSPHTVQGYIKASLHFIRSYLVARLEIIVFAAVAAFFPE